MLKNNTRCDCCKVEFSKEQTPTVLAVDPENRKKLICIFCYNKREKERKEAKEENEIQE